MLRNCRGEFYREKNEWSKRQSQGRIWGQKVGAGGAIGAIRSWGPAVECQTVAFDMLPAGTESAVLDLIMATEKYLRRQEIERQPPCAEEKRLRAALTVVKKRILES